MRRVALRLGKNRNIRLFVEFLTVYERKLQYLIYTMKIIKHPTLCKRCKQHIEIHDDFTMNHKIYMSKTGWCKECVFVC